MNESRTQADQPPRPRRLPLIGRTCLIRGRPNSHERPALAAGHPTSWRLLTDGSVLQDEPYPFPVFDV